MLKKSINPLNKMSYEIPEFIDDSEEINKFVKLHKDKKIIAVQGLGFVGAVMSLVCSNSSNNEYAVIGIDLPNEKTFWKIKSINEGVFPLIADDPKIDNFFEESKKRKNFYATYDPLCFQFADIIIVDINLDVQKHSNDNLALDKFDVDLNSFKDAMRTVGENLSNDALVLIETTVPPGTCNEIIYPIITEELKKRNLPIENFALGHSYERVMPGPEYIDSIREFPRVYSGINEQSAMRVKSFLETIIDTNVCELTRLDSTNASEMAKVLENSYRASNIAFAVEWSRFAEEAGVDLYEIVNSIRVRKTHSNLMYPGIGVGGYCLTKDPLLASWAKRNFFGSDTGLEMSVDSVSINDRMPRYAFERLINVFGGLENKKVLFLGVSYRGDVGDTRFSPVAPLVSLVRDNKAIIKLHDPFITYWQEQDEKVETDFDHVLGENPDLIIISTGHSFYKSNEVINKLMQIKSAKIYDTIGILTNEQIETLEINHQISVLGRGDV